jgi:hypothetical protein
MLVPVVLNQNGEPDKCQQESLIRHFPRPTKKLAIAQVNATLREILTQMEKLNITLASIAQSSSKRPL